MEIVERFKLTLKYKALFDNSAVENTNQPFQKKGNETEDPVKPPKI